MHKRKMNRIALAVQALGACLLITACGGGGSEDGETGSGSGGGGGGGGGSGSTDGSTSGGGAATPSGKAQIAYVSKARQRAVSQPEMAAVAAFAGQLAASGGTMPDAAMLSGVMSAFNNDMKLWRGRSSGNALATQDRAFALLSTHLKGKVPNAPSLILAAHDRLLGPALSDRTSSPEVIWRATQTVRLEEVLAIAHEACNRSAGVRAACDALLQPLVGTPVSATETQICDTQADLPGCSVLRKSVLSKVDVQTEIDAALAEANAKAAACIEGKTECTGKSRAEDAERIRSRVAAAAKAGRFIGLVDDRFVDTATAIANATGDVYESAGKIRDAFRVLDPLLLRSVFDADQWLDIAFGDGDESQTLASTIKLLTSIGSAVGDIAGTVKAVLNLFGSQGTSADAQLLKQIQALQQLVSDMRREMHTRFDVVDIKLDAILQAVTDGLGTINNKSIALSDQIVQVQLAASRIEQQVGALSLNLQAYASDLARQDLNQVIGLVTEVGYDRFQQEVAVLFNYIMSATADSIHAGPSMRDWGDGLLQELSLPLGYNVNYLSELPARRHGNSALYGQRVPNPSELVYAAGMYAALVKRYPDHARRLAPTLRSHIQQVLDQRVAPVEALVSAVRLQPTLFPDAVADAQTALQALRQAIVDELPVYLAGISAAGQDLSVLDPWAGADQTTRYVPQAVRSDRVPHCSGIGSGPVLTVPAQWQALFASPVARNAEAMGLGTMDICYSLPADSAGGWTNYQHWKHKPDRYTAWGTLQLTLKVSFGGTPTLARQLVEPEGNPGLPSSICFWFTEDDIRIAHNVVPAASVVGTAWTGSFRGNGWCYDYRITSNLRQLFDQRAVTTLDWASSSPAALADTQAAVARRLGELQRGFMAHVAVQLKASGSIGLAAQRVAGTRQVLQRYLELALPETLSNHTVLRALFYGDGSLGDVASLARRYEAATAADAPPAAGPDLYTDEPARLQELLTVLQPALDRLRRGDAVETVVDLAATRTQLELLRDALGTP